MPRGGKKSTSFKPGVSGNPGGRPKKLRTIEARRIFADVKALARECAPEAIETLASIMKDPKAPPAARISAAQALLDRGHGRPSQAVDVAVTTYDYSQLTDEQLDELGQLMGMIKLPSGQSLAMWVDDSKGGD
jgi:hypothetical protein